MTTPDRHGLPPVEQLRYLVENGSHESVIDHWPDLDEPPPPEYRAVIAEAYAGRAADLAGELWETEDPEERERLCAAAADALMNGVCIDPGNFECLMEWGALLADRAEIDGENAAAWLRDACGKYAEAAGARPGDPDAHYDWAGALAELADLLTGAEAEALRREAVEKYRRVLVLNPVDTHAMMSLGNTLSDQAELLDDEAAAAAFAEAEDLYTEALRLGPGEVLVLYNRGLMRRRRALRAGGAEAGRLLLLAQQDFEEVLRLSPGPFKTDNPADQEHAAAAIQVAEILYARAELAEGPEAGPLFDAAAAAFGAASLANEPNAALESHWGDALDNLASFKEGVEQWEMRRKALLKYESAAALDPEDGMVWYNWGVCLARLAHGAEAPGERRQWLREALEKYRRAVACDGELEFAHHNLGDAAGELAELAGDDGAADLLREAVAAHRREEALNPGSPDACAALGAALMRLARLLEPAAAEPMLREAEKYFLAAAKAGGESPREHYNLGLVLAELAEFCGDAGRRGLLAGAAGHLAEAARLDPGDAAVLRIWAEMLSDLAEESDDDEAEQCRRDADAAFRASEKIDDHFVTRNLHARMLYVWAQTSPPERAESLLEQALALLGDAGQDVAEGTVLCGLSRFKGRAEARRLLQRGCKCFADAAALAPEDAMALWQWGAALTTLAGLEGTGRARALHELAEEKFQNALALEPGSLDAHFLRGVNFHEWAAMTGERALFLQARDAMICAEALEPGSTAYNLACVSARLGEEDACREWLRRAADAGTLPGPEVLAEDPDLDTVRKKPWFKGMLK